MIEIHGKFGASGLSRKPVEGQIILVRMDDIDSSHKFPPFSQDYHFRFRIGNSLSHPQFSIFTGKSTKLGLTAEEEAELLLHYVSRSKKGTINKGSRPQGICSEVKGAPGARQVAGTYN